MLNLLNIKGTLRAFTSAAPEGFAWLAIAVVLMAFALPHPYYLSVTDIKYDPKASTLQLSVKLFTNDLEDALKKSGGKQVDVLNPTNKAEARQVIFDYIKKRLLVSVNSKLVDYHFIGYEREEEAVWVYLESGSISIPKTLSIENKLLYDYLPQQINIVHTEVNDNKQSGKATNPDDKFSFNFSN